MTEMLTPLTLELRSILANFYRRDFHKLTFEKRRDTRSNLIGITFLQPAMWPDGNYAELNSALLSLHHNGYIVYGANTITLKPKLAEVSLERRVLA
jgi:hypothetical protein